MFAITMIASQFCCFSKENTLNSHQTPPDKSTSASPDHLAVPIKQPKYSTSASKNSAATPPTKAAPIPSKCKS